MNIIIEENDIFKIYIFIEGTNSFELAKLNPRKILHCIRLRPFVREEVWNIQDEKTIINDFIIKFKALKENEEVN